MFSSCSFFYLAGEPLGGGLSPAARGHSRTRVAPDPPCHGRPRGPFRRWQPRCSFTTGLRDASGPSVPKAPAPERGRRGGARGTVPQAPAHAPQGPGRGQGVATAAAALACRGVRVARGGVRLLRVRTLCGTPGRPRRCCGPVNACFTSTFLAQEAFAPRKGL